MKANEAPERVYLDSRKAWQKTFYDYFTIKAKANDIEYIRTDVFIEKACNWLRIHIFDDYYEYSEDNFYCADGFNVDKMVENFAKAMKGE